MATGKRYYWIKLKDSFFADDGPADFLMSQPDGANYVVLYQMLCLKTINTDGRLSNQIGEVIIPYDVEKIRRTCKYFPADTVRVALNLYKALGLIYEDRNGTLTIAEHDSMVGSETDWAEKKRRQLMGKDAPELPPPNGETGGENFPIEIRDKEIKRLENRDTEIRDKSTEGSTVSCETVCRADVRRVIDAWNSLGLQTIRKIPPDSQRGNMLRKRIKDYGLDTVLAAIEKVRASAFLNGNNNKGWTINFDWFIKPNNFPKVLEGNYDNRVGSPPPGSGNKVADSLHESYNMMAGWAAKEDGGE